MAVDSDGTRFVCTTWALYALSPNGMELLITGHKTEVGFANVDEDKARFECPCGIALDGKGNALVADTNNHMLRKVALRCGTVSTLAGSGEPGYRDGMHAAACFDNPWGIVVDVQGTIFVADCWKHCLRRMEPANGVVSTLAGDGEKSGDFADGQSASARFHHPRGLAVDTDGHLIVALTTVAGSAEQGKVNGTGVSVRFSRPSDVVLDEQGAGGPGM